MYQSMIPNDHDQDPSSAFQIYMFRAIAVCARHRSADELFPISSPNIKIFLFVVQTHAQYHARPACQNTHTRGGQI
jgi:hypothetical protein